jgi:fatty aldehyde-generating acyl-ACP reductase
VVGLIGHQESWPQISSIVRTLRAPGKPPLALDDLREIVPWIPPRSLLRVSFRSTLAGATTEGVYIETFITPDELTAGALRPALAKVRDAVQCAAREHVKIAALGGFTSILLEGAGDALAADHGPVLTTGNTLTAAFIVKGIERAAALSGRRLGDMTLAIAGATGDIGSACARYLAGRVRRLLLSARRADRLARLAGELEAAGRDCQVLPVIEALGQADAVISVASLARPEWDLAHCRASSIVCDAGYPKNLRARPGEAGQARVFHGGMGQVRGGWVSDSPLVECFYRYPAPFVVHGCMLEAVVLAMEGRWEAFSQGRGRITPPRIDEMWRMAERHGIALAPFFNHDGLWAEQPAEARA